MENSYQTKININVDWADLDLFGHVNNVVFFKYIQTARVNYCERIGLTSLNDNDMLSFMVASSQCQFKKPLIYPNQIQVSCKVDWIKNSSFQLSYQIIDSQSLLIAEATDVLVVFNHQAKTKESMPDAIRGTIEKIEHVKF